MFSLSNGYSDQTITILTTGENGQRPLLSRHYRISITKVIFEYDSIHDDDDREMFSTPLAAELLHNRRRTVFFRMLLSSSI